MEEQTHQATRTPDLLGTLWDHLPFGIQIFGMDGRNLGGNAEAVRILGGVFPPGFDILEAVAALPEDVGREVRRVFAGEVVSFPPRWYRFAIPGSVRGDGAERRQRSAALAGRGIPIRDASGRPDRVAFVFEDVSEILEARDAAEARKTEAEAERGRLEVLVAQLPAGMVLAEVPSGRIILANDELERILGHGILESPAVSEYGQWGAIHPDGRAYAPEEHPLARAVMQEEVVENAEVLYRQPSGDVRVLSVNAAPIRDPSSGRAHSAVASFIDVTDRKRTESAHALLAEAGQLLVSSLDVQQTLQSTVDLAVPAVADMAILYLREGEIVRRVALAHPDPAVIRRFESVPTEYPLDLPGRQPALEVIRTGVSVALTSFTPQVLASTALDAAHLEVIRDLNMQAYLVVPLPGRAQTVGALGFVMTSSNRRLDPLLRTTAEELGRVAGLAMENARLYAEAQKASRQREEVLAVVSHDLRNPLSVVDLAGKRIRAQAGEGVDASRLEPTADLIQRAVDRMRRLIDDLLDLESMESGRLAIECRSERIADVIQESVTTYRMVADQASVTLTLEVSGAASLRIRCDRGRLLQVLGNLLENAIKYTPAGGGIDVLCHRVDGHVEVRVADSGPGVRPEDRDRIFDRFWQEDPRRPGAGLGLSIARGIVEAHGGRIWVEGREGAGSVFVFRLPALIPRGSRAR